MRSVLKPLCPRGEAAGKCKGAAGEFYGQLSDPYKTVPPVAGMLPTSSL